MAPALQKLAPCSKPCVYTCAPPFAEDELLLGRHEQPPAPAPLASARLLPKVGQPATSRAARACTQDLWALTLCSLWVVSQSCCCKTAELTHWLPVFFSLAHAAPRHPPGGLAPRLPVCWPAGLRGAAHAAPAGGKSVGPGCFNVPCLHLCPGDAAGSEVAKLGPIGRARGVIAGQRRPPGTGQPSAGRKPAPRADASALLPSSRPRMPRAGLPARPGIARGRGRAGPAAGDSGVHAGGYICRCGKGGER